MFLAFSVNQIRINQPLTAHLTIFMVLFMFIDNLSKHQKILSAYKKRIQSFKSILQTSCIYDFIPLDGSTTEALSLYVELNPFLILSCLSRGFLAAGTETIRERNKKYPGHIYLNKSDPVSLHSFLF